MKLPNPAAKSAFPFPIILVLLALSDPLAAAAPLPVLTLAWEDPGRAKSLTAPGQGRREAQKAEDSLVLKVKVALPPGWYINSHAPLDSFLVPTRLEVTAPGWEFGAPRYPEPVIQHSAAMGGDMSLFKGDFRILVTAHGLMKSRTKVGTQGGAEGAPQARVTLHYQSCDGNMCWPPKSVSAVSEAWSPGKGESR